MGKNIRKVRQTFKSRPTLEGAGVRLNRVFGNPHQPLFDPFLLLDDFHSNRPEDYLAGFPMHPHRGIETITYLLHGTVIHRDSMGHSGAIEAGDVQWMTAGSGIIHEEMPQVSEPELWGFQLWANLPASHKMMDPRYRSLRSGEIPAASPAKNVTVRIICGTVAGVEGPVRDIVTQPELLDVRVEAGTVHEHPVASGRNVFCYVIEGEGFFGFSGETPVRAGTAVLFEDGDAVRIAAESGPVRFLLASGKPIREPVVWYGPIVMNTREELALAFDEYRKGTFVKKR